MPNMAFRLIVQVHLLVLLLFLLDSAVGETGAVGKLYLRDEGSAWNAGSDTIYKRASESAACASLESQVDVLMSQIEDDSSENLNNGKSSPGRHTELRRGVLWKPKSKDRKSLLACMRRASTKFDEEASMDDSVEEELRCLRAQQRIDSMRDPEAKALAQASECQRQLKRQIEMGGC